MGLSGFLSLWLAGRHWTRCRCSVEGTNNIFSYLPRANLENFRDSFRYSTHDCKLPRAVHQSTGQACFAPRFTTLHFETGAFQGTGGLVQQRLRSPRTVYTTDAPLETEEDTPVRSYTAFSPGWPLSPLHCSPLCPLQGRGGGVGLLFQLMCSNQNVPAPPALAGSGLSTAQPGFP
jgi:hypothetical protein